MFSRQETRGSGCCSSCGAGGHSEQGHHQNHKVTASTMPEQSEGTVFIASS